VQPVVLVDGRNVIRSRWPNLRETELVARATDWAGREGVEPVFVFDGSAPDGAIGTGRESADDWIAREAARLAAEGRRVWLVSSDRGLRQRVAPYVEQTIGGGSFVGELEGL
jgi:predicted RNA-binding protein with PIN domain